MLPKRHWIAWCWSVAAVVACTEGVSTGSERPDNAALGIAEIQVSEAGERTTVVGLDAQGREVGRLELQYGRIVLGAEYGGLAGTTTEGRQLNVEVLGQTFEWQTAGFTNTRHMPALAPTFDLVAAFVADSRVRPILQQSGIGWKEREGVSAPQSAGADDFDECIYSGWNATVYNPHGAQNVLLQIRQGNTTSCNGGRSWMALVLNQDGQDLVMQCCGVADSGAYAEKSCALHGTCSGGSNPGVSCTPGGGQCHGGGICTDQISSCGNGLTNKCKACFTPIPYTDHCAVGSSEYVHFGQHGTPHHTPGEEHHPERAFYGCRTYGDECRPNGSDCLGEGWGEGAAEECCSGSCSNFQCSSRPL